MKPLDESTLQFIEENKLSDGVAWLMACAPKVFNEASDIEIEVLPGEGTDKLLALKVYGDYTVAEFRLRRHALYADLHYGYDRLYNHLSIFQRRVEKEGA